MAQTTSNMEKELKLSVENGVKELIVWHGDAKPNFKVRKPIKISGTIGLPLAHLTQVTATQLDYLQDSKEVDLLAVKMLQPGTLSVIEESYLTIDRDKMVIAFVENAGKEYESTYTGALTLNPDFIDFGINDLTVSYVPIQLAQKIKMNRAFFENKTVAMQLVSELMGFEAKINKEVEAKADERATRRVLMAQTVTTNIPEGFKMKMPIFKGGESVVFEVEINIDPQNLNCVLVSPEANDLVTETKNNIIDEQKAKIVELHPGLRIFEI